MEKGYNTDVVSNGASYHVQTEDWGIQNPFLVTRIYRNGAVIKTIKTPYQSALKIGPEDFVSAIRLAMKEQHYEILDLINSGQV